MKQRGQATFLIFKITILKAHYAPETDEFSLPSVETANMNFIMFQ
jgi:hypothetical protein